MLSYRDEVVRRFEGLEIERARETVLVGSPRYETDPGAVQGGCRLCR